MGIFPIDGTWAEVQSIPGNSLTMTLTSSGSSVTGSGAFAGEAGPAGTVAVTGTVSGADVHLDLVLTSTAPTPVVIVRERFDGTVRATELRGTMTDVTGSTPGTPFSVVFARQ